MSGKKSQRHAEKPNVAKLADWRFFFRLIWYILYIYAAFLDLMHVPRSYLQVAMIMVFFCLAAMVFQVNTVDIHYF